MKFPYSDECQNLPIYLFSKYYSKLVSIDDRRTDIISHKDLEDWFHNSQHEKNNSVAINQRTTKLRYEFNNFNLIQLSQKHNSDSLARNSRSLISLSVRILTISI